MGGLLLAFCRGNYPYLEAVVWAELTGGSEKGYSSLNWQSFFSTSDLRISHLHSGHLDRDARQFGFILILFSQHSVKRKAPQGSEKMPEVTRDNSLPSANCAKFFCSYYWTSSWVNERASSYL
jgi:hypothetical protein